MFALIRPLTDTAARRIAEAVAVAALIHAAEKVIDRWLDEDDDEGPDDAR